MAFNFFAREHDQRLQTINTLLDMQRVNNGYLWYFLVLGLANINNCVDNKCRITK